MYTFFGRPNNIKLLLLVVLTLLLLLLILFLFMNDDNFEGCKFHLSDSHANSNKTNINVICNIIILFFTISTATSTILLKRCVLSSFF
jgi:hypothetical protein